MQGLDAKGALEDIAKRCGISEDIIKRVQKAETEYIIEGLSKGYRVNIPGRGTFRPEIKQKLLAGGKLGTYIKPTFSISSIIKDALAEQVEFKANGEEEDEVSEIPGVLLTQLPSLL